MLTWKQHIEYLKKKISLACFALRNIKDTISLHALKLIYFANVHCIKSYGIIFWGDSSCANKVFILQRKVVRIITNSRSRESCRDIFKKLEIMTAYGQYIYSLVLYVINNKHIFNFKKEIHTYKTRALKNLYLPAINVTKYSKGAYIASIKVFNHLPLSIKVLTTDTSFKTALKRFLYHHSFYSMNEYYQQNWS
jgi:hypothetical protein